MALSLRGIVFTRYGIPRYSFNSFSVINDVLRIAKNEANAGRYRTADGRLSLRSLLSDLVKLGPLTPVILFFTTSQTRVTEGESVTLAWRVKPAIPNDFPNVDIQGNNDHGFSNLALTGRDNDKPSYPQTVYELSATRVATAKSTVVEQVDKVTPPPPPTTVVGKLAFFNCNTEHRTVNIWVLDATAGTGWVDHRTLSSQYDASGTCPGAGATPLVVSFQSGHQYQIVAVDPRDPYCGQNDPTIVGCQRWTSTFTGSTNGPTLNENGYFALGSMLAHFEAI